MKKTILVTGSTDGIGLATATTLIKLGHTVLLHGRSQKKLDSVKAELLNIASEGQIYTYQADLSIIEQTKKLAESIKRAHKKLDVLINNAGVFIVPNALSNDGYDVRFMVNTVAPYLLTQQLLPLLDSTARIVNLASAAQSSINPEELAQPSTLPDDAVYAKSKLALIMWSRKMALEIGSNGPVILAVNPKSFLGSKMVKQAYGVAGAKLQIGADILVRAALSDEFKHATGSYFDNDIGQFTAPHPDANDNVKITKLTEILHQMTHG